MMRITLITVGRLQEAFWRDACAEYEKRLRRYCDLRLIECNDEKAPENASAAQCAQILKTEGERILKAIDPAAPVWVLDIRGNRLDSEGFAEKIAQTGLSGSSHVQFVIGGSLGLWKEVCDRAVFRISFSDMTFPHQLMRVILLEQIYRAFRIQRGEPYHK